MLLNLPWIPLIAIIERGRRLPVSFLMSRKLTMVQQHPGSLSKRKGCLPSPYSIRFLMLLCLCLCVYINQRLAVNITTSQNENDDLAALPEWGQHGSSLGRPSTDHHYYFNETIDDDDYDPCHILPTLGEEGMHGFQALYSINIPPNTTNNKNHKLLCVLHNTTCRESIIAAYQVYGHQCDKFLATTANPINDVPIGITANILSTNSTDWGSLIRLLKHVQKKYDDLDIIHVATERTLVIVENLRQLIASFPATDYNKGAALYFGGPALFADDPTRRYCSPGAGYSLNRRAIELILQCPLTTANTNIVYEQLADCLYQHNVACQNTMDGRQLRYLEYGPEFAATWHKRKVGPIPFRQLEQNHNMFVGSLMNGISSSVVGIHLVDGERPYSNTTHAFYLMKRFDAIVRKTCEENWSLRLPHGALDENGNAGYVHDATFLRRHPLKTSWSTQEVQAICTNYTMGTSVEGPKGIKGLRKIRVRNETESVIRLFCVIFTHAGSHKDRVEAVAETYGQRCDGFMAASTLTDRRIGAVNLLHEGPESYDNMWLKVRAIWSYIYKHYLDDYDFFHMGGDDMYVIPENLKHLVSTGSITGRWNQTGPLYLGSPMTDPKAPLYFCGGGAGYTLNRMAVKLLVEELFSTSACAPHYQTSQEDRKIGDCFRRAGVLCPNTQDEAGEERYHHLDAEFHASWWKHMGSPWNAKAMRKRANIVAPGFLRQISKDSVTFHLKDTGIKQHRSTGHFADDGMRRYHGIVYGHCNQK